MSRVTRTLLVLASALALAWGVRFLVVGTAVGAGYAAHVTCSFWFVSGQPPEQSFDEYVQYEVWPLGPALALDVDEHAGLVTASALGVPRARARYEPGAGCTLLPAGTQPRDSALDAAEASQARRAAVQAQRDATLAWPAGAAPLEAPPPPAVAAAMERAFAEPGDGTHRVTKAVVVVHRGQLVAERYAPGVAPATPLISWSMAKSVLATLVGIAEAEGKLERAAPAGVPEWSGEADARRNITLDQLLRMSSGLAFDERYGATTGASIMLLVRPDAAHFAAEHALDAAPDSTWYYSSGTANIVARLLGAAVAPPGGPPEAVRAWAQRVLFAPIGVHTAVLEADASGTLLLSSFAYLSARDWARFGELHREDGVWQGRRVLPAGWVEYVTTPTPPSNGEYGAHWWLNHGTLDDPATPSWPALPPDTYAARGHSGQYVFVIPSEQLVIVRLGLTTPDGGNDGAAQLAEEVVAHYR